MADLRSERRKRRSAQGGSLTAEQRQIYKIEIAKRKEKIRRLKLLLTGQPKPHDPEESLEDHSVERETAAPSMETKCGTDGGLGSARSGQETLLGHADGGCGGLEIKLEGDAEKAADPAMRGVHYLFAP